MNAGEFTTRLTVYLAVACYLYRVWCEFALSGSKSPRYRLYRLVWTVGSLFMLAHIVLAFGVYHGWSHQQAYHHTAEQTSLKTGLNWGGGIYFNELLMLMWLVDVVLLWSLPVEKGVQYGAWFWSLHVFFAFMMFNATVVFGPPYWSWLFLGVVVIVFTAQLWNR